MAFGLRKYIKYYYTVTHLAILLQKTLQNSLSMAESVITWVLFLCYIVIQAM